MAKAARSRGRPKGSGKKKKEKRGLWFKAQKEFGKGRISKKDAAYPKVKVIYERMKKELEAET